MQGKSLLRRGKMGWIPAILAIVIVGWFVLTYNALVRLRN